MIRLCKLAGNGIKGRKKKISKVTQILRISDVLKTTGIPESHYIIELCDF